MGTQGRYAEIVMIGVAGELGQQDEHALRPTGTDASVGYTISYVARLALGLVRRRRNGTEP